MSGELAATLHILLSMKANVKIEFQTRQFEFAHGRAPRGRGVWMFEFEGRTFSHCGTFAEARAACVAAVRAAAPANYSATVFVEVCT